MNHDLKRIFEKALYRGRKQHAGTFEVKNGKLKIDALCGTKRGKFYGAEPTCKTCKLIIKKRLKKR